MSASLRVVLVTGCSYGGIGFSLCQKFAEQGCKVYATARRLEAMEDLTHENITCVPLDVTSEENIQEVMKTIIEAEGRIDIVVNNAGVMCSSPLIDVPMERVQSTFETNVFSVIRVAKAIIPHMASRHSGTIVNISSIVGETPMPWSGIYAATKSSVTTLSEVLYMECLPFNINVMLVAPGGVKTNISSTMLSSFSLPSSSLYSEYIDHIVRGMGRSQDAGSMPADEFARRVVKEAMKERPPRYMTLGSSSRLFVFFNWFPRGWLLRMLWGVATGKYRS